MFPAYKNGENGSRQNTWRWRFPFHALKSSFKVVDMWCLSNAMGVEEIMFSNSSRSDNAINLWKYRFVLSALPLNLLSLLSIKPDNMARWMRGIRRLPGTKKYEYLWKAIIIVVFGGKTSIRRVNISNAQIQAYLICKIILSSANEISVFCSL